VLPSQVAGAWLRCRIRARDPARRRAPARPDSCHSMHVVACGLHVARLCTLHAQASSIGSRLFSPQRCWSPRLVCTRCTRATLRSMMECRESAARKPTHPQIEPSAAARASASSHSADTGRVCSSSLTPL
jgi:hypothetical protein